MLRCSDCDGMQEAFFTERGTYYRANNLEKDRTTLLFIHGLSWSSSVWTEYERTFEQEYNIVSVDLRGHGKSQKPNGYDSYTVEKIADDISALIDHLSLTSFIPISHSLGTLVAVALLRQHPQGARCAVFLSPVFGMYQIPLTRATRLFANICASILSFRTYSTKPRGHVDYWRYYRNTGDWNLRRIMQDIPNTTLHIYFFCLSQMYSRDFDPWWLELRLPILIIHGKRDSISPVEQSERLAGHVPAKLVLIEKANHILPLNNFEEVNRVVADYCARYK